MPDRGPSTSPEVSSCEAVSEPYGTLLPTNPAYAALMGDQSGRRGRMRNGVWWQFLGHGVRAKRTPEAQAAFEAALVADLRSAAERYPADQRLRSLVSELRSGSERFAELWDTGAVGRHEASRKTIEHPPVGAITLDCDVLTVAGSDQHIMVYTAEPGTEDAERLALAMVLGTQSMVENQDRRKSQQMRMRDGLNWKVAGSAPGRWPGGSSAGRWLGRSASVCRALALSGD